MTTATATATDRLTLQVAARNHVNTAAMGHAACIREILTPYVGRKVRKVSGHGGWVAALQRDFDAYFKANNTGTATVWIAASYSWISLELKHQIRTESGEFGGYVKQELAIARIDDSTGELLEILEPVQLRTDYTADWLQRTRDHAATLEEQARHFRSQLREFDR